MPPRLTDEKRAAILADIAAREKSAGRIARDHGVSTSTVSRLAAKTKTGDGWQRSKTRAATRAREADLAHIRTELANRRALLAVTLHDVAEREIAKMTQPALYWDWGGKEHSYDERLQPEPHAADRRAMMTTAGHALDKSLKLVPPKEDAGAESRSVIGELMAGLAANYAQRHDGPPPEYTEPEEPEESEAADDDAP